MTVEDKWRAGFKKRLAEVVAKIWGSSHRAIAQDAASKSLYRWVSPASPELPKPYDIYQICRQGSVSPNHLFFGGPTLMAPELADNWLPPERWSKTTRSQIRQLIRDFATLIALDQRRKRFSELHALDQALAQRSSPVFDVEQISSILKTAMPVFETIEADIREKVDAHLTRAFIARAGLLAREGRLHTS
ncbi:MAG: hypothetical protein M3O61_14770 [Gemmatimonadota bacterium]|nr:hypothetical protein [Gemmatimonadota bacterium]